MAALRIVFMGTPELAGESLRALAESPDLKVLAVVCQPDRPRGRGLQLQPPPVKQIALEKGIPVLQPERAREESFIGELRRLEPELIAVAAYGQILPRTILDLPRHGCLNVHTSLLPKYRGAAPIQWAILNGETVTGVTIMKMDEGMDTGGIVSQETTEILPEYNSRRLHDRLAKIGARLLLKTIPGYVAGELRARPQPADGASYAPKIKKQDGRIDWTQPARAVWSRVRAMAPWPGAFTHLPGPEGSRPLLLKILEAEISSRQGSAGEILSAAKEGIDVGCGSGSLRIVNLQLEGGRPLGAGDFLAGHLLLPGTRLG